MPDKPTPKRSDESEAIRFMLIKSAIFVLVPAIAGAIAAYVILSR